MFQAEHTPEQIKKWIADCARAEMAKACELEDLRTKANDIEGFRQYNVNVLCVLFLVQQVTYILFDAPAVPSEQRQPE